MCIRFDISYCGTPDDGDRLMTCFRLSALEVALEMCVIYEKASFLLGSWAFLFYQQYNKIFSVFKKSRLLFGPDSLCFGEKTQAALV